MDEPTPTVIVFRRWQKQIDPHENVIVLFPEEPSSCTDPEHFYVVGNDGTGSAGAFAVIAATRPVSLEDADVQAWLKRMEDYVEGPILVRKRITYAMDRKRRAAWKEMMNR